MRFLASSRPSASIASASILVPPRSMPMRTGPAGCCCCMAQAYREAGRSRRAAAGRAAITGRRSGLLGGGRSELGQALLLAQLAQLLFLELAPRFLLLQHLLVRPLLEVGGLGHRVEREAAELRDRGLAALALELDVQAQLVGRIGVADRLVERDQ